jgi:hypothetical protein
MRRIWLVAWLLLVLASCRKENPSRVAAMLPRDVAAKLSPEFLAVAEALPANLQAFGYFDLGGPLTPLPPTWADYHVALNDLLAMAKRRWGVDLSKLRGYGAVAVDNTYVLVAALPPPQQVPPALEDEWTFGRLGALTTFGPRQAVAAVTAAAQQQKPFYVEHAAWLKAMLTHAAGARMMGAAVLTAELRRELPASVAAQLTTLEFTTFAVGNGGAAIYLHCNPQGAAGVRALVDTGVGLASQALSSRLAELPSVGPGPLAKALVQPLAQALLKDVKVTTQGDTVAVELPWHGPTLPPPAAAAAITDRVIAPGEWAVAQLDLRRPALEALVASLDVLGVPLDRGALTAQLKAEVSTWMGTPPIDPHGFVVSAGTDLVAVSIQGPGVAPSPTLVMSAVGDLAVLPTAWGIAVTGKADGPALQQAALQPSHPLPLAASKLLAQKGYLFAAVDLSGAPAQVRQAFGNAPLRSLEAAAAGATFQVDVLAEPGKASEIEASLKRLIDTMKAQAEPPYRDRANGPAALELIAIMQHQQVELMAQMATSRGGSGDRLHFEREFPLMREPMFTSAMAVGVLAAIAIPAYLDFLKTPHGTIENGAELTKPASNSD